MKKWKRKEGETPLDELTRLTAENIKNRLKGDFKNMKRIDKSKWCWVAKQYKAGWRLGLDIQGKTRYIQGYLFENPKDIRRVLNGGIVFVTMANLSKASYLEVVRS